MDMSDYRVMEVYADFIYFVLMGTKEDIDNMVNVLNQKNNSTKYFSLRIDIPFVTQIEKMQNDSKFPIVMSSSVEAAQSHAFTHSNKKKSYAILSMDQLDNKIVVQFPKLEISEDEDDPEVIIINWLKKQINKIPKIIKKTIKFVTLMGKNEDIILYIAKTY